MEPLHKTSNEEISVWKTCSLGSVVLKYIKKVFKWSVCSYKSLHICLRDECNFLLEYVKHNAQYLKHKKWLNNKVYVIIYLFKYAYLLGLTYINTIWLGSDWITNFENFRCINILFIYLFDNVCAVVSDTQRSETLL